MAAKLSNLGDKMSEANLHVDGQVEKLAQGAMGQHETEETVPLTAHQLGPLSRGCHLAASTQSIA